MINYEKEIKKWEFLKDMVTSESKIPIEKDVRKISLHNMVLENSEYYGLNSRLNEYWNYASGKYYYHKEAKNLNEFIGEMLANILKLDSAHYEPVYFNGNLMIRTPDFRKSIYEYTTLFDLIQGEKGLHKSYDGMQDFIDFFKFDEESVNNFLKLVALDIFMGQKDRAVVNIMLKKNRITKKNSFAPIFDYTYSFSGEFNKYENDILCINLMNDEFKKFATKYPKIYEYLSLLLDVDIVSLLIAFAKKYNMVLPDYIKEYYQYENDRSNIRLQKIMN